VRSHTPQCEITQTHNNILQQLTSNEVLQGEGAEAPAGASSPEHTHPNSVSLILSEEENASLIEEFGKANVDDYKKQLTAHIGSEGKKYKSHFWTLRKWMWKDKVRKREEYPDDTPGKDDPKYPELKILMDKKRWYTNDDATGEKYEIDEENNPVYSEGVEYLKEYPLLTDKYPELLNAIKPIHRFDLENARIIDDSDTLSVIPRGTEPFSVIQDKCAEVIGKPVRIFKRVSEFRKSVMEFNQ
jgi:hypothetical protein